MPSLVFVSLAKGVTWELLAASWSVPLLSVFQILVAAAVAVVARQLIEAPPKHLEKPFYAAIVFQNSSTLPLVICQAISKQPLFNGDPEAFAKLTIYIFLYNIGWQLVFWTAGYSYITSGECASRGRACVVAHDILWLVPRCFLNCMNPSLVLNCIPLLVFY
jgi:predicted permease